MPPVIFVLSIALLHVVLLHDVRLSTPAQTQESREVHLPLSCIVHTLDSGANLNSSQHLPNELNRLERILGDLLGELFFRLDVFAIVKPIPHRLNHSAQLHKEH